MHTTLKLLAAGAIAAFAVPALAQDEVSFGTNWLAQAEHGGYYQAVADGTYEKYGLKVTIRQGGPQGANRALLTGRHRDLPVPGDPQLPGAEDESLAPGHFHAIRVGGERRVDGGRR